jgi:GT2 family glycosyltransferase
MGLKKMGDVTISIVSYCQKDLLSRCLDEIERVSLPSDWQVVVVDNNSKDGSADMVMQNYNWVKLIRLDRNLGFGRGHNTAYTHSESPIFIVLNPDVRILPGSLEFLVETLEKFPKAAIAGPQLLNPDGSIQFSARRFYDWKTVFARRLPLPGRKRINDFHLMKDLDQRLVQSVDWVLGAAMAIRRSAFGDIALFDTRYKLYFEDVDLCYFAQKRGWDVLYCPQSRMIHDHQRKSAKLRLSFAVFNHFVSWVLFYLKSREYEKVSRKNRATIPSTNL